jgi:hypothetical protein
MADQNWVLLSHIYQNAWTSSVTFSNTINGLATNSAGGTTTLDYTNAPVFRIHFKMQINTGSDLSGSQFRTWGNYSSGNDFAMHWENGNQTGQKTPGSWNGCGGNDGYSSSYQNAGYAMKGSQFSSYAWGPTVTDIDGNSVVPTNARRQAWSTGWLETHYDNQAAYYPWHWFYGMCTDQETDGSSGTGTYGWGAWGMGAGGCSTGPYIDTINLACDYNFRGDFFLFRGMDSNNQVNE